MFWLSLKRREFDGFSGFFVGSENPSVHRRTRVLGFCKNAEKARIVAVLTDFAAAETDGRINLIHHRILSCRHGALRTVEV